MPEGYFGETLSGGAMDARGSCAPLEKAVERRRSWPFGWLLLGAVGFVFSIGGLLQR